MIDYTYTEDFCALRIYSAVENNSGHMWWERETEQRSGGGDGGRERKKIKVLIWLFLCQGQYLTVSLSLVPITCMCDRVCETE